MIKSQVQLIIQAAISIPKSVYFNLRYLPFSQAIYLPILVHYKTKIKVCSNAKIIVENAKPFNIKLGFGGNPMASARKRGIIWLENGIVTFKRKAILGEEFCIRNSGTILFGENFYAQQDATIWAKKEILMGDDILLGWNVFIRDHDGHVVLRNGIAKEENKPIHIGNHVWICSDSAILKGSTISDDSVVGYRSLVTRKFDLTNALIAGSPASLIQNCINWER